MIQFRLQLWPLFTRPWVMLWMLWLLGSTASAAARTPGAEVRLWDYEVLETLPHDQLAFTQGLLIHDGVLYESTGLYGKSELRKVEIDTGKVLKKRELEEKFFGEGLALFEDRLYQLTWREGQLLIWDLSTLEQVGSKLYWEEGWGLTTDGDSLIMSDGSATLYFRDPATFEIRRRVKVKLRGRPVPELNELEYIRGRIWANVWGKDHLVEIDPETGRVVGLLDLSGLDPGPARQDVEPDVLNGIAWDPEQEVMYVTGKLWARLYMIKLHPPEPAG